MWFATHLYRFEFLRTGWCTCWMVFGIKLQFARHVKPQTSFSRGIIQQWFSDIQKCIHILMAYCTYCIHQCYMIHVSLTYPWHTNASWPLFQNDLSTEAPRQHFAAELTNNQDSCSNGAVDGVNGVEPLDYTWLMLNSFCQWWNTFLLREVVSVTFFIFPKMY